LRRFWAIGPETASLASPATLLRGTNFEINFEFCPALRDKPQIREESI